MTTDDLKKPGESFEKLRVVRIVIYFHRVTGKERVEEKWRVFLRERSYAESKEF